MTRRSREVGIIKACVMGAVLAATLAFPAQAQDKKLTLSGTAVLTTDYIFRGISNTDENPAVQASFDAAYGIFYAGIWGSNTDFGDGIELDYYAGIRPKWGNITFDIGGLYYNFPGGTFADYVEVKAGATYAKGPWTLGVTNYWSPDFANAFGNSDAIEGGLGYTFGGKLFNFFTPTISGGVGFQSYEEVADDYTYWNAGLTLGFMERWSADVRYYDTDYNQTQCFDNSGGRSNCDARVVGTVKATF
jgi:uncharacterized protein (TIGR02001 family)